MSRSTTPTWPACAAAIRAVPLYGLVMARAIRVPTANVSLIDFKFDSARETSADEVNTLMEEAAKSNRLKGIIGINKAPTVSVDFNHDPHSSIYDATLTQVMGSTLVKVCAWYDNEWGFSNRMLDTTLALMAAK